METIDRQLRYFVKIAEARSLSRAAEDLSCTQSILSRQLSALERDMGQALFSRTGRGVILTDAGTKLLSMVGPAFNSIDDAITALRSNLMDGTLVLSSIHSLSYSLIGPLLAGFSGRFPSVKIKLLVRSSEKTVELIESKRADAGFVYDTAVVSPDLRAVPLFHLEMCFIARLEDSLPSEIDLRQRPIRLVVFPQGHALRRMLVSSGIEFTVAAEVNTFDAMLDVAACGGAYCILPSLIPKGYLATRGLRPVRISQPTMARQVSLVVRSDSYKTELLQALEAAVLGQVESVSLRASGRTNLTREHV